MADINGIRELMAKSSEPSQPPTPTDRSESPVLERPSKRSRLHGEEDEDHGALPDHQIASLPDEDHPDGALSHSTSPKRGSPPSHIGGSGRVPGRDHHQTIPPHGSSKRRKSARSGRSSSRPRIAVDSMAISNLDAAFMLGRGGRTKQKICAVSGCKLNLREDMILEFVGTPAARERARLYVDLVIRQRQGPVTIDLCVTQREDLTVVEVPSSCVAFVTGHHGAVLRRTEEEWCTLMFFVRSQAPDPRHHRRGSRERAANVEAAERFEGGRGAASHGIHADREQHDPEDRHQSEETFRRSASPGGELQQEFRPPGGDDIDNLGDDIANQGDPSPSNFPTEQRLPHFLGDSVGLTSYGDVKTERLLVFGNARGRRGATLKVMSAIEQKIPGYFTQDLCDYEERDEGLGTDVVEIPEVDFSYALGRDGTTRRKLATASGAILEYIGRYAIMWGTRAERQRVRQYLRWLIDQRTGSVYYDDVRDRDDVTFVSIPRETYARLGGARGFQLRKLEIPTETFCFMVKTGDRGKATVTADGSAEEEKSGELVEGRQESDEHRTASSFEEDGKQEGEKTSVRDPDEVRDSTGGACDEEGDKEADFYGNSAADARKADAADARKGDATGEEQSGTPMASSTRPDHASDNVAETDEVLAIFCYSPQARAAAERLVRDRLESGSFTARGGLSRPSSIPRAGRMRIRRGRPSGRETAREPEVKRRYVASPVRHDGPLRRRRSERFDPPIGYVDRDERSVCNGPSVHAPLESDYYVGGSSRPPPVEYHASRYSPSEYRHPRSLERQGSYDHRTPPPAHHYSRPYVTEARPFSHRSHSMDRRFGGYHVPDRYPPMEPAPRERSSYRRERPPSESQVPPPGYFQSPIHRSRPAGERRHSPGYPPREDRRRPTHREPFQEVAGPVHRPYPAEMLSHRQKSLPRDPPRAPSREWYSQLRREDPSLQTRREMTPPTLSFHHESIQRAGRPGGGGDGWRRRSMDLARESLPGGLRPLPEPLPNVGHSHGYREEQPPLQRSGAREELRGGSPRAHRQQSGAWADERDQRRPRAVPVVDGRNDSRRWPRRYP